MRMMSVLLARALSQNSTAESPAVAARNDRRFSERLMATSFGPRVMTQPYVTSRTVSSVFWNLVRITSRKNRRDLYIPKTPKASWLRIFSELFFSALDRNSKHEGAGEIACPRG
jgi:hypothetical protein